MNPFRYLRELVNPRDSALAIGDAEVFAVDSNNKEPAEVVKLYTSLLTHSRMYSTLRGDATPIIEVRRAVRAREPAGRR